ncbi:assimilatory sulfite reductase (NADPH) hemoprotein subunit [soil metagenome]
MVNNIQPEPAGDLSALHKNESIKDASRYLRGTILDGLADVSTGALAADDTQLTKFHGIYQQDDRDVRKDRRKHKLEPAYSFMIRVRVPGGVCTPQQWLEMDAIATTFANQTIKLTTRQAFQFHGVIKTNLKRTVQEINAALLDTIAACGDVNRNVMCNPNPYQSDVHAEALAAAHALSDRLTPATRAYHDIWLTDAQGEKVKVTEDAEPDQEPIYGKHYLPRKFKIVVAVPPSNDVDIYAHDLGFIAIVRDGRIAGYNITVGGGMGMTHGNKDTYPVLAQVLGYCPADKAVDVAEKVVTVQRDYGDRKNRSHARLKYTIDDHGLDWFRDEVEKRLGYSLGEALPFDFDHNGDRYGWIEDHKNRFHLTLFVQNGRVKDTGEMRMLTGLRAIAKIHKGDFRLTANQNLIVSNVSKAKRAAIEKLLVEHGMEDTYERSGLRLNSLACVALPTCGLSLAESERYLPDLITELESVMEEAGLADDAITIRMTGCPNGCARPYISEIAFVGRAPGKYNVYLGGGFVGDRLNKLYKESVLAEDIKGLLAPVIHDYAKTREPAEKFGDFVIRKAYVAATTHGRDFHANL